VSGTQTWNGTAATLNANAINVSIIPTPITGVTARPDASDVATGPAATEPVAP